MAYRRRKPPEGLIFHSDRGVQYAAKAFRDRLSAYGIRQSINKRTGLRVKLPEGVFDMTTAIHGLYE